MADVTRDRKREKGSPEGVGLLAFDPMYEDIYRDSVNFRYLRYRDRDTGNNLARPESKSDDR